MSMSNETRTAEGSGPTVRCGRVGVVSHTTARSHPLAGEGSSDAGMDVSSPNCARQVSQPAGRPLPYLDEVARLYRAGWQAGEIASKLGVKTKSVYEYACRARRAGIDVPPAPHPGRKREIDRAVVIRMAREGLHAAEIARRIGRGLSTVASILAEHRAAGGLIPPSRRGPGPWTRWDDDRFAHALAVTIQHGAKVAAAKMGTTPKAVLIQIQRRGISVREMRRAQRSVTP
jgi:transposase